ncbi:Gfo/Idh/MocA family oxidoreductase [Microvirga sp. BT689]|uniref:Gfo/Idh/MocA family protein n=1 Tax=Microvirga arvi TaxID=2778731 RepID=UPI00194F8904|nr:Gfo/Idh/MocA family oxidoreductase [Microvirga arvi]MBM6581881.1 Gfo/Idh/MocA family oxidoreductase [Microvirga arvi]
MTLRILQVGLGNRGTMWGRIIAHHPRVAFAGIVDPDPARVSAFTQAFGDIPSFSDLGSALKAVEADAVLLVTPPNGHLDQARCAFAAGLPVLAEKPLALDMDEARRIVDLAEATGCRLSVCLNFRFLPVSQEIRRLVADQEFGAPGFGTFNYHRNRDWWRPGMNKYPLTMRYPMMLEQSIHHLDLIRYCYGREVEAVSCRTWNPSWSVYAHDANVSCLLTLEGGLEVNYLGTWTGGWNELKFQWRTDCERGVIVQQELFSDLATARTEDDALTPVRLPPCTPFVDDTRMLLDAFVEGLRGEGPLPCTGRDHLQSLALCLAAIESSETGQRVDVREFTRRHGIRRMS